MGQSCRRTSTWLRSMAVLPLAFAAAFSALRPAHAADDTPEREHLAALTRVLDLTDRLAEHAANTAPQERARYHFDHARLRKDLQRVRAGIQDYLTPPRAQPRDSVELSGDYRQSSPPSEQEAPQ